MAAYSPSVIGAGSELTSEEWLDLIVTPLQAQSIVMSLPGVNSFQTEHPTHIPRMAEPSVDATLFRAPNEAVTEFEGATSELVLMGRSLKTLKAIVKVSNESLRSSQALTASQITIVNLLRKQVDIALLNGNAGANITGLIPQAGSTVRHSRFVADAVLNSSTTVTSATAAFVAGDVGSFVTGTGIPAGATVASVTNATTIVLSAAATATGSGVTITITTNYSIYDRLVDALTASLDGYASPKLWISSAQSIGVLRKLKDTQGHPLLSPDTTVQGAEQILGRTVIPAPAGTLPHGTAMLVDPRTVYVAIDLTGYVRVLFETYAGNDQTGLLIVSRFDAGVTIPQGLVVVSGLGPN